MGSVVVDVGGHAPAEVVLVAVAGRNAIFHPLLSAAANRMKMRRMRKSMLRRKMQQMVETKPGVLATIYHCRNVECDPDMAADRVPVHQQ